MILIISSIVEVFTNFKFYRVPVLGRHSKGYNMKKAHVSDMFMHTVENMIEELQNIRLGVEGDIPLSDSTFRIIQTKMFDMLTDETRYFISTGNEVDALQNIDSLKDIASMKK